jgi:ADP-ribosyl-[dinitrogen reductase] hydrolase
MNGKPLCHWDAALVDMLIECVFASISQCFRSNLMCVVYFQIIRESLINTMSAILGCLLGGAVGDAAGATLEFRAGEMSDDIVNEALRMPGGGAHNVAAGQVTDDTELALSLMSVLVRHDPSEGFPRNEVALAYSDWFKSKPFDVGMTTRRAFSSIMIEERVAKVTRPADVVMNEAKQWNEVSEANGALMRCASIGLWAHDMSHDTIADYARQDARLSHPNQVCQDASAVFCVLIAYLVNNPRDFQGAVKLLDDTLLKKVHPIVACWIRLSNSICMSNEINCKVNSGHVKYAFTLALYFLRHDVPYEIAIFETLKLAGDTDTNACIVGNLIGCLHGHDDIPAYMSEPVLRFDCTEYDRTKTLNGHNRPDTFRVSNILDVAQRFENKN